jgi:thymidine kinase
MFSGKSTELLRLIRNGEIAKKKTVLVKYAGDTRYSDEEICTHDRVKRDSYTSIKLYDTYNLHKDEFDNSNQIGIDEGQFFPDLVEFAEEMANKGKRVIIAMLDGDFSRNEFKVNKIEKLLAICDDFKKLRAVCAFCGKEDSAGFSKRTVDSKETELIGGEEMYKASCRKCYLTN